MLCYSIEIEVQYYEKEDEMLTKVESAIITAKDAPLRDVLSSLMKVHFACLYPAFPHAVPSRLATCHLVVTGITACCIASQLARVINYSAEICERRK